MIFEGETNYPHARWALEQEVLSGRMSAGGVTSEAAVLMRGERLDPIPGRVDCMHGVLTMCQALF